jgi:hypothetical protein
LAAEVHRPVRIRFGASLAESIRVAATFLAGFPRLCCFPKRSEVIGECAGSAVDLEHL